MLSLMDGLTVVPVGTRNQDPTRVHPAWPSTRPSTRPLSQQPSRAPWGRQTGDRRRVIFQARGRAHSGRAERQW